MPCSYCLLPPLPPSLPPSSSILYEQVAAWVGEAGLLPLKEGDVLMEIDGTLSLPPSLPLSFLFSFYSSSYLPSLPPSLPRFLLHVLTFLLFFFPTTGLAVDDQGVISLPPHRLQVSTVPPSLPPSLRRSVPPSLRRSVPPSLTHPSLPPSLPPTCVVCRT